MVSSQININILTAPFPETRKKPPKHPAHDKRAGANQTARSLLLCASYTPPGFRYENSVSPPGWRGSQ
jgi:hypothetical protein